MAMDFHPDQLVLITSVDKDGFCSRDHHPQESDVGRVCRVKVVETEEDKFEGEEILWYYVLTVETLEKEPRVLELIDHEVQKISFCRREKVTGIW